MSPYELRNNNSFKRRRLNFVWHGTELVSYLGPNIWDLVPNKIKESESLNGFKFQKMGPWRMSMKNMQNIYWASRAYNNIKNWFLVK